MTDAQLEQSLQQLAQKEGRNISEIALIAIQQFVQQHRTDDGQNDPWVNPNLDLPRVDTGMTDFAYNHDHYLYGTKKIT